MLPHAKYQFQSRTKVVKKSWRDFHYSGFEPPNLYVTFYAQIPASETHFRRIYNQSLAKCNFCNFTLIWQIMKNFIIPSSKKSHKGKACKIQGVHLRLIFFRYGEKSSILVQFSQNMAHLKPLAWAFVILCKKSAIFL